MNNEEITEGEIIQEEDEAVVPALTRLQKKQLKAMLAAGRPSPTKKYVTKKTRDARNKAQKVSRKRNR